MKEIPYRKLGRFFREIRKSQEDYPPGDQNQSRKCKKGCPFASARNLRWNIPAQKTRALARARARARNVPTPRLSGIVLLCPSLCPSRADAIPLAHLVRNSSSRGLINNH